MCHTTFDSDKVDWTTFLESQEGRGKYFQGVRYQRGFGIFQNLGRLLMPVVKNFADTAKDEGIKVGSNILKDLSEGANFQDAIKTRGNESLNTIKNKFQQCGKGKRRIYRDQLS